MKTLTKKNFTLLENDVELFNAKYVGDGKFLRWMCIDSAVIIYSTTRSNINNFIAFSDFTSASQRVGTIGGVFYSITLEVK